MNIDTNSKLNSLEIDKVSNASMSGHEPCNELTLKREMCAKGKLSQSTINQHANFIHFIAKTCATNMKLTRYTYKE